MPLTLTNLANLRLARFGLAALLSVGIIALAGCGSSSSEEADTPATDTPTPKPPPEPKPPVATEGFANAIQPNVLIIAADDLGWGDVGYNESEIKTPYLDTLAEEGLRLDRFYTFPFCSLTRAALMTGRQPLRLNVTGPISRGRPKPPLQELFISQVFKQEGYQTWMVGKWHLGGEQNARYRPYNRGFDSFYGHIGGGVDHYEHTHWINKKHDWFRNGRPIKENGYTTSLLTDEAIRKIKERDQENPFFLYLSYSAPHQPIQAPSEYIEKYSHIKSTLRRRYAAMVDFMDMSIGRVIATLEREGLTDNTLVLFLSDNGGALSGGASNAPLKGQKGEYYEGGVRVPAIIKWPQFVIRGQKSERMITVLDLFPTLIQAANIKLQPHPIFDGRAMWNQLIEKEKTPDIITLLIAKNRGALWSGDYKLLVRPTGGAELYNIYSDPEENYNLARKHTLKVDELYTLIKSRFQEYKENRS